MSDTPNAAKSATQRKREQRMRKRKLDDQNDTLGNNTTVRAKKTNAEYCRSYRARKQVQLLQDANVIETNSIEYVATKFKNKIKSQINNDKLDDYCRVCERIWWTKQLVHLKPSEFLMSLLPVDVSNEEMIPVCSTCHRHIKQNKTPPVSVVNGFKFCDYPDFLKEVPLNLIEERLISPRLPFMQIRNIQHFAGSKRLVGQVINVPANVQNTMLLLPRKLEDDKTINVHLKKHVMNKSTYLSGCVSKSRLKLWLRYLCATPLYMSYGVTIDKCFFDNEWRDEDDEYNNTITDETYEKLRQEWEDICKFSRKHCEVVDDENITSEMALGLHQHTMFWDESLVLTVAPGMGEDPIPLSFDNDAEELSFPTIYLGKPRLYKIRATPFTISSHEIRCKDRRAITSEHILYMAAKVLRLRMIASMSFQFKSRRARTGQMITKAHLEDENFLRETLYNDDAFLRDIPNSVQYWCTRKKDLFAMMRQLGKPTLFFTLSASEHHWSDLIRYVLRYQTPNVQYTDEEILNMPSWRRAEIVNSDPVICCLYFARLVNVILAALSAKRDNIFGQYYVKHYFKRIEFQHRGSPHCHMLLWLDNAPAEDITVHGEDMPATVQLIDAISTVDASKVCGDRQLQTHNHTHTCFKKTKNKCRFGAPFWPMDETRILIPVNSKNVDESLMARYRTTHCLLEENDYDSFDDFLSRTLFESTDEYLTMLRHNISRPRVFHKRHPKDKWTSPFNPVISELLQSNMDIQYVLDEYSCGTYVADYINKSERGYSKLHRSLITLRDDFPDLDYERYLKEVGRLTLNNIEMCTQEAAWFLLRLPMSECSTIVEYIGTEHPSERAYSHKPMKLLDSLDDGSTDIWWKTKIEKYEMRPLTMNAVCLADFVSQYNIRGEKITRRKGERKVIRWRNYDPVKDVINYKREQVLLFHPFRSEELDLLNDDRYLAIYTDNERALLEKRKTYASGLDIDRLHECVKEMEIMESMIDAGYAKLASVWDPPNEMEYVGIDHKDECFVRSSIDELREIRKATIKKPASKLSAATYAVSMQKANLRQHVILGDYIVRLVFAEDDPMQVFLTGAAGTGKSFTIRLAMLTADKFTPRNNCDNASFIACGTTGKTASNIDGTTVHSFFKIGISKEQQRYVKSSVIQTMRYQMNDVRTVFIDEISMMSPKTLQILDDRLRRVSDSPHRPFGAFNMFFTGDLRQLPPVNNKPIYTRPEGMLQTDMCWHNLSFWELTEVMRQKDASFSSLLTKIGDGEMLTKEERATLEQRFRTLAEVNQNRSLDNVTRIFYTNNDVDDYNLQRLQLTGAKDSVEASDEVVLASTDVSEESKLSALTKIDSMPVSKTGNLAKMLWLQLDFQYTLTANIDVDDRLVNGAVCVLKYIERDASTNNIVRLWLSFGHEDAGRYARMKHAQHSKRLDLEEGLVPITRRKAMVPIGSNKLRVRRTQFPLVPAAAITIHKSQGSTYDSIVYDYHKTHDQSLVYVGLSRVTSLDGLILTQKDEDHTFYHNRMDNLRPRLIAELKRLRAKPRRLLGETCLDCIYYSKISSVMCFNVQSLPGHKADVDHEFIFRECDLLAFTETWMLNTNIVPLEYFDLVCSSNAARNRAGGVAIYQNKRTSSMDLNVKLVYLLDMGDMIEYGDVCAIQYTYTQNEREVVVAYANEYLRPRVTSEQVISFIGKLVSHFDPHERLIVAGDFNFEWNEGSGLRAQEYIRKHFDLAAISSVAVTTIHQTRIDIVLSRNYTAQVLPYISYWSTHRPLLIVSNIVNENTRRPEPDLNKCVAAEVPDPSGRYSGIKYLFTSTIPKTMKPQTKQSKMDSTTQNQATTKIKPTKTSEPSTSSACYSDDEDEETTATVSSSEYSQEPDYSQSPFWTEDNLKIHVAKIQQYHNKENKKLCITDEEVKHLENRFKNRAVQNNNYFKFQYKTPIRVLCVTNIYGLLINSMDNWRNNRAVSDIAYLGNKHRVSVLCGSATTWWHKPSKHIMTALIERVFVDIKSLVSNAHFCEGIELFELNRNLRERVLQVKGRILNATVQCGPNEVKPGIFNMKLYNTPSNQSIIEAQLGSIKGLRAKQGKWNTMLPPSYFHAALVVRMDGFKITKSGFTLDMYVENLAIEKVVSRQKIGTSVTATAYYSDEDSDDDADPIPTKRFKPIVADW